MTKQTKNDEKVTQKTQPEAADDPQAASAEPATSETAESESKQKEFDLDTLTPDQLKTLVMMQEQIMQKLEEDKKSWEKKREELLTLLGKSDKYLDQLVALKSDFEAYKRRTKGAEEAARAGGVAYAVEQIFPFLDTLDKARTASGNIDAKSFELIYRQLNKALFEMGVEELDVLGKPFNHDTANAVTKREVEKEMDGCVVEVFQKGYRLGDKILKYAQVIVGEYPEKGDDELPEDGN